MRSNCISFPCNVHVSPLLPLCFCFILLIVRTYCSYNQRTLTGMRLWGGMESYQSVGLEHQNQSLKDTWHAQGEFWEEQFDREQMPRVDEEEDCCGLLGPEEPPSRVPWWQRQGWDGTSTLGLESFLGFLFLTTPLGWHGLGEFSIIVSIHVPGTEISVSYALIC